MTKLYPHEIALGIVEPTGDDVTRRNREFFYALLLKHDRLTPAKKAVRLRALRRRARLTLGEAAELLMLEDKLK